MTFEDSAQRGDVVRTVQFAIFNGSLWAIGSSWATGIRAITIEILPSDMSVVWAEAAAVLITTVLGVSITLFTARGCCGMFFPRATPLPPDEPPTKRLQTLPARVVKKPLT